MEQGAEATRAKRACIGLGANLGDAALMLTTVRDELASIPQTRLCAFSPLYRSAPVDAGGPDFINAVALIETTLAPHALLAALQRIEAAHGRERPYRHAPRTLDLDLLLYGNERIATADLTVPHPRLHERAFALRPLADVAPEAHIPGVGSMADCLARVADQSVVKISP
jgi:2-amino-4-hydroxy-6-hydroxymethyldihydropteridine diphosphokinase